MTKAAKEVSESFGQMLNFSTILRLLLTTLIHERQDQVVLALLPIQHHPKTAFSNVQRPCPARILCCARRFKGPGGLEGLVQSTDSDAVNSTLRPAPLEYLSRQHDAYFCLRASFPCSSRRSARDVLFSPPTRTARILELGNRVVQKTPTLEI